MRFMMLVRASKASEAGALPSKELVAAMGRFDEEMAKAGVLLAGEGRSRGTRRSAGPRSCRSRTARWSRCTRCSKTADFPAEVLPPEDAAREQELRDELQRKAVTR